MKTKIILMLAIIAVGLSSCKKDLATDWVGTYNGTITGTNNVSRVVISKVNDNTIKIELQANTLIGYYTYATIGGGSLSSASAVNVNEDGTIYGYTDTYHFTGSGTRNGNSLAISGQAVSKTNSSDIKLYAFSGNK
jgi:hypothetical protein